MVLSFVITHASQRRGTLPCRDLSHDPWASPKRAMASKERAKTSLSGSGSPGQRYGVGKIDLAANAIQFSGNVESLPKL